MKQGTGTGRTGIQILSSIASNLCSARLTDYGINMLRTTIQDHEFVYSAFHNLWSCNCSWCINPATYECKLFQELNCVSVIEAVSFCEIVRLVPFRSYILDSTDRLDDRAPASVRQVVQACRSQTILLPSRYKSQAYRRVCCVSHTINGT
jgi:hypothetical protein